jgi:hypothetical protein
MRWLSWLAMALWLVWSATAMRADEVDADEYYEFGENSTGSTEGDSSDWTGLTHTVTYTGLLTDFGPVPAGDELAKTRVTWRRVKLNTAWGIAIQAQLHLNDANGRPRDIDWFQGARVLVARSPYTTPDWSDGHKKDDTLVVDVIAHSDGSFNAAIPLTDIPRSIGSRGQFQVAVMLARRTGDKVVWDAAGPSLTGSVAMLEIPGPPKLSPTLELINAVSDWPRHGGNGMALVRAVNGLHKLGKQQALAALREYVELAGANWNGEKPVDPANIETGDHNCVFWIIRSLFEPARAGTRIPKPAIGYLGPPKEDQMLWPLFPIELVDDVPFMVANGWSLEGVGEHPASHIEWAESYGVLRAEPLRPADDPMAVADRLLSLPKYRRLWVNDLSGREIKLQAWRMVADLLPKTTPAGRFNSLTADQWKQLRQYAADRKLRWDDTRQTFALESKK